nr:probable glutamyl endopeptidase, chloroplastic isoform X1 [Ipomoea batatas]
MHWGINSCSPLVKRLYEGIGERKDHGDMFKRLQFKGQQIERKFPAISAWTVDMVQKRFVDEKRSGAFGRGKVLDKVRKPVVDVENNETIRGKEKESDGVEVQILVGDKAAMSDVEKISTEMMILAAAIVKFGKAMVEVGSKNTGKDIIKKTFSKMSDMLNVAPTSQPAETSTLLDDDPIFNDESFLAVVSALEKAFIVTTNPTEHPKEAELDGLASSPSSGRCTMVSRACGGCFIWLLNIRGIGVNKFHLGDEARPSNSASFGCSAGFVVIMNAFSNADTAARKLSSLKIGSSSNNVEVSAETRGKFSATRTHRASTASGLGTHSPVKQSQRLTLSAVLIRRGSGSCSDLSHRFSNRQRVLCSREEKEIVNELDCDCYDMMKMMRPIHKVVSFHHRFCMLASLCPLLPHSFKPIFPSSLPILSSSRKPLPLICLFSGISAMPSSSRSPHLLLISVVKNEDDGGALVANDAAASNDPSAHRGFEAGGALKGRLGLIVKLGCVGKSGLLR